MPTLYHVDAFNGTEVRTRWKRGRRSKGILFAGPKGHSLETASQAVGESGHGGWVEYAVHIPASLYTESMHPRTKKVVRVTKRNIQKYKAFVKKVTTAPGLNGLHQAMMLPEHRNILGFDLTRVRGDNGRRAWFYELPGKIKFSVYRVFSCDACREYFEYGSDDEDGGGGSSGR